MPSDTAVLSDEDVGLVKSDKSDPSNLSDADVGLTSAPAAPTVPPFAGLNPKPVDLHFPERGLIPAGYDEAGKLFSGATRTVANLPINAVNALARATGHPRLTVTPFAEETPAGPLKPLAKTAGETMELATRGSSLGGIPNPPSDFSRGIGQATEKTAEGLLTPESIASLPFLEFKAGRLLMFGQMLAGTPEQMRRTYQTVTDPDATNEQKWAALGQAGINLAMTGSLGLHLGVEELRRSYSPQQVSEQLKEKGTSNAPAKPPNAQQVQEPPPGGLPAQPGQPLVRPAEEQAQAGTSQRGGPGQEEQKGVLSQPRQIAAHPIEQPWPKEWNSRHANEYGASLDPSKPEQGHELLRLYEQARQANADAIKAYDGSEAANQRMAVTSQKSHWLGEALESATGSILDKDIAKAEVPKDYKPPFPDLRKAAEELKARKFVAEESPKEAQAAAAGPQTEQKSTPPPQPSLQDAAAKLGFKPGPNGHELKIGPGTVSVDLSKPDHITVNAIGMAAAERGKGIGTQLLSKVEQLAKDAGKPVTLEAIRGSAPFYEKRGFVKIGTGKNGPLYQYTPEVLPAIRRMGGAVVIATPRELTHNDIIAAHGLKAEDVDQRGFVGPKGWMDRETTAQTTGLPTQVEPGRQRATDLPRAQTGGSAQSPPPPHNIITALENNNIRIRNKKASVPGEQDFYAGSGYTQANRGSARARFTADGMSPDRALQALKDAQEIGPDATVEDMWNQISKANDLIAAHRKGETPEAITDHFFDETNPSNPSKAKGQPPKRPFNVGNLAMGDSFEVNGVEWTVSHIDPDGNDIQVRNDKGHIVTIPDNSSIAIDHGNVMTPAGAEEAAGQFGPGAAQKLPDEKSPELLSRKDFNRQFGIHFDVKEGNAQERIPEMMKGIKNGMVSGDIDITTPEGTMHKQAHGRGWARAYGFDKPGAVAYGVRNSDIRQSTNYVKPGSAPVFVVQFEREGQNAHSILIENAIKEGKPVNAQAVHEYGIVLPHDYVRDGKVYRKEFQGQFGPGAAQATGSTVPPAGAVGSVYTPVPLADLAEATRRFPYQKGSFQEKLKRWMDSVGIPIKDKVTRAVTALRAMPSWIHTKATTLPAYTDLIRRVEEWDGAEWQESLAGREYDKAIRAQFGSRAKLAAMSNWINAGGDKALLARWAALTKDPALRKTYTDALNFGPAEERYADEITQYHEEMLARAQRAGALEEGLENYLHRYYRSDDPVLNKKLEALEYLKFSRDFNGFKRRYYDSDFEAEQAGLKPEKDAAKRILAYNSGFTRALIAREFVRKSFDSKAVAKDGRPELDVMGGGRKIPAQPGQKPATLIKPKWSEDTGDPVDYRGDYATFSHPAFKKWTFASTDTAGNPIFVDGEVRVHPDFADKYAALFERSWWSRAGWRRALRQISSTTKQTLLVGLFHPFQITTAGIEHFVGWPKMFGGKGLVELNPRDPAQIAMAEKGLFASEPTYYREGLGSGGLLNQVPILGEYFQRGNDWIFHEYIPRWKMTVALEVLRRDRIRYRDDLRTGKITDEQLQRNAVQQATSMFGGGSTRRLFRSATFQDNMRMLLLAPDFEGARIRQVMQAFGKYGAEQRLGLAVGGIGLMVIAKSVEYALTGKMNLSPKHIFSVTYNGKEYSIRNPAADLVHMLTDPVGFWRNRLNPITVRPLLETATGRDQFGRKRSYAQQIQDEAKQIVPMPAQGLVSGQEQTLWESGLNSLGFTEHRRSDFTDMMKQVNEWKKANHHTEPGEFVYDPDADPYHPLTSALASGSKGQIQNQLASALANKGPAEKVKLFQHYARSLAPNRPFTGSALHEHQFLATLSPAQKQDYSRARAERLMMWRKFLDAWRLANTVSAPVQSQQP